MRKIVFFFATVIFAAGCVPGNGINKSRNITSVSILEDTMHLSKLWEKNSVALNGSPYQDSIFIVGRSLIFLDYSANNPKLLGIDIETGNIIWESAFSDTHTNAIVDQDEIFLTTSNYVAAFNIKDGSLVWKNVDLPASEIDTLVTDNDNLYTYYSEDIWGKLTQVIYVLDKKTGAVMTTNRITPYLGSILGLQKDERYYWTNVEKLFLTEGNSSNEKWAFTGSENIILHKIYSQSLLAMTSIRDHLYVIDINSGQLRWQYSKNLSEKYLKKET